ncbi:hypothetical protein F441_09222 [Phytophthora nicotianae CJ01A1]|uniref:Uncharacterized protein n=1 Tax=Phytophthora nicotianae CJ01A1 TaxID=1317063 RepID=W2X2N1_PHYNI|nr:hypothetical protein F441_09222 [Phytophthora nicotianae CJ01A1]
MLRRKKDKATARSLAETFAKPVRIRNKIADENGGVAPSLDKLQNVVYYYRKSKMNNTYDKDELEKLVWASTYTGAEVEEELFSFSVKTHPDGKVLLGEGTDSHDFFVDYTTKALLR